MNDYQNAIEIENLTKKYDGFTLDSVSFNVPKGSIMGFIGQNGAGKTTTIKTLLGITRPDSGTMRLLGMENNSANEVEIKQQTAAVFDELPFHEAFTAEKLGKMFRGLYRAWDFDKYYAYLDKFSLPRKKKIGQFSKGMKMKLQISTALSHGARLLIMDEATTGLDPVVRNEILDIFREYLQDENNSILMSSHITGDLEKIADVVTFIDMGRIMLTGNKDEILEKHGVLKCSKEDFKSVSAEDYISARRGEFGVEMMVADRQSAAAKYPKMTLDKTTLEEIMLFYVNRSKKEW